DYNATAPVRPGAKAAMLAALEAVGNPSSVHAEGRKARGLVEGAREAVAAAIGACRDDIAFTSGGTEAVALALRGAMAAEDLHIIASALEHDAAATIASDLEWPVLASGIVDLEWLGARLRSLATENLRPLVSL